MHRICGFLNAEGIGWQLIAFLMREMENLGHRKNSNWSMVRGSKRGPVSALSSAPHSPCSPSSAPRSPRSQAHL